MRFEELEVWKRAARLSADIFRTLVDLREFGFKDQVTRAGLSISSNIAEGYERTSNKDRAKFLAYAKGSCAELRSQIYIGMDVGFIERSVGRQWLDSSQQISKMIYGLIKYVREDSENTA